jgi:hypothetical protein
MLFQFVITSIFYLNNYILVLSQVILMFVSSSTFSLPAISYGSLRVDFSTWNLRVAQSPTDSDHWLSQFLWKIGQRYISMSSLIYHDVVNLIYHWNSITYFSVVLKKLIKYILRLPIEAPFFIISFIFCWVMHIQKNNITPATSRYFILLPTINELNPLKFWYDFLMYEESSL